jgi:hypothetical protein
MLEHRVEQTNLTDETNYNDYWENIISRITEEIYTSSSTFKSAYMSNSQKVFKKINSRMKVVPIDLKETLKAFYMRMIPEFTPDDGPKRGIA